MQTQHPRKPIPLLTLCDREEGKLEGDLIKKKAEEEAADQKMKEEKVRKLGAGQMSKELLTFSSRSLVLYCFTRWFTMLGSCYTCYVFK